jgi:hypothetical protein
MAPDELTVELMGTEGCHLCDEAHALIGAVRTRRHLHIAVRDIMDDEALEKRYWDRIPVLRRTDTGAELGWPFDAGQLERFLC